jgi:hypothetical protein
MTDLIEKESLSALSLLYRWIIAFDCTLAKWPGKPRRRTLAPQLFCTTWICFVQLAEHLKCDKNAPEMVHVLGVENANFTLQPLFTEQTGLDKKWAYDESSYHPRRVCTLNATL